MGLREVHPLAELIPVLADPNQLATDIAQNGQQEPVYLYEGKVIEGRAREKATQQIGGGVAGNRTQYRDWVLLSASNGDPLDWMVRRHVASHNPGELDRIRLAAAVLDHYKATRGSTHKRLSEATGVSVRKVRLIDWLADAGQLGPVLTGERELQEQGRAVGLISERKTIALGRRYGHGDKFDEATHPLKRYLASWKRKDYEFRHLNPREAERRLGIIDSLVEELRRARADIEKRSHAATLSAPPERKERKG